MAETNRRPASVSPQTAAGAAKRQGAQFRGRRVPKGTNFTEQDLEGLGKVPARVRAAVKSGTVSKDMAKMLRQRMFNLSRRDKSASGGGKR